MKIMNKKRTVVGGIVGSLTIMIGVATMSRLGLMDGYEKGWKDCLKCLNNVDPEACAGFMDTVHLSWN